MIPELGMARTTSRTHVLGRSMAERLALLGALATLFVTSPLLVSSSTAHAQDAGDQQSAAAAYDHATALYVSREYAQAAALFETAHRLAPASAALIQAVRAHGRADNHLRAATLALRLEALYPDDRAAVRAAAAALRRADQFARVDVTCDGCRLQLDGALIEHPSFFLRPDTEHQLVAVFPTGEVSETVSAPAGETRAVAFEAPPAPIVAEPEPEPTPDPIVTPDPEPSDGGGGIHVAVPIVGLVVTAALGGVLIWSGVDALDGVPAYEMNPTVEGLADGRMREERTNWLIAGTAVAGAATAILMIFTDWDGDAGGDTDGTSEETSVQALFDVHPGGAALGLRGRF